MFIIHVYYLPVPLDNPVMTLDLQNRHPEMKTPVAVLALPDGGALVAADINNIWNIVRLDQYGAVSYIFKFKPSGQVTDFILTLDDVLILQLNGVITRVKLSDGTEVKSYKVDVEWLWRGISVDGDNLLMIDHKRGEVFSFKLSDQNKEVKVRDIIFVRCISEIPGNEKMYAVCANNKLLIYDSTWKLQRSIGGLDDWFIGNPVSGVVLPNNNFLIVDKMYKTVLVLTFNGHLVHHMDIQDKMVNIQQTSYQRRHLWIVYFETLDGRDYWHLKQFNIFRS